MINVVGTTTPRLDLGQALDEYVASQQQYIADQVLPITPVEKKKFVLDVFERSSQLKLNANIRRAPGADSARTLAATSEMSVSCYERSLEFLVDDSEAENYSARFDYEYFSLQTILRGLMIAREYDVAAKVFNTTTWTGASLYLDTAAAWSATTTDILADINTGRDKIRKNGGGDPNTLIISAKSSQYLYNNDYLNAAVVYTQGGSQQAIAAALAPFLGLETILVGGAIYSSAGETAANTHTGVSTWSDSYAMLCYRPRTASIQELCLGRTFLWTADSPTLATVDEYRDDRRRSNVLRVRHHVDEKIIDPACGFLFKID